MSFGFPRMEVVEEGDEVVVRVWISGIDENDVELEVKEDWIKIDIEKEFSEEGEEDGVVSKEWENSSFSGKISLPCKVVPSVPEKSYVDGVFEVRMKRAV